MAEVAQVTTTQFQKEVLDSPIPVIVDFYTTWCPPCKFMAPIMDSLADEYDGRVKFVKIDIEQESALGGRFSITAVPTFIIFKGGDSVDVIQGALPPDRMKSKLDAALEP